MDRVRHHRDSARVAAAAVDLHGTSGTRHGQSRPGESPRTVESIDEIVADTKLLRPAGIIENTQSAWLGGVVIQKDDAGAVHHDIQGPGDSQRLDRDSCRQQRVTTHLEEDVTEGK